MNPEEMTIEDRKKRLWEHLLKLEELTGFPLRKTRRDFVNKCPILNFAPGRSKGGYTFSHCSGGFPPMVTYEHPQKRDKNLEIFKNSDSYWWMYLEYSKQKEITHWLKQKIKEHYQK